MDQTDRGPDPVDRAFVPILVTTKLAEHARPIIFRLGPQLVLEIHEPERVPPLWLATLLRELGEVIE